MIKNYQFRCLDICSPEEAAEQYGMDVKGKALTILLSQEAFERIATLEQYTIGCSHDYGMDNHEFVIAVLKAMIEGKKAIFIAKKEKPELGNPNIPER